MTHAVESKLLALRSLASCWIILTGEWLHQLKQSLNLDVLPQSFSFFGWIEQNYTRWYS